MLTIINIKRSHFIKAFLLCFLVVLSFSSCFKNVTKLTVVYENNFETYNLKTIEVSGWLNGSFGAVNDIRIMDYNGNKVLGRFNDNLVSLTLPNLPEHNAISIEFDLYIHDTWKNDLWKMSYDGVDQLLTGFSNDSTVQQSYPNWLGNGSSLSAAGADAFTSNLPGACRLINSPHGTSMYKMVRTFLHSNSSLQFSCSDAGNYFNLPCDRSWSMDNLKITAIKN